MNNKKISYQLLRSQRKTLGMQVIDGVVKVRSPSHLSTPDVDKWVQSKKEWINKQVASYEKKRHEKLRIEEGGTCLFLGERKNVFFKYEHKYVQVEKSDLIISSSMNRHKEVFEAWLKAEATTYINARCKVFAERMGLSSKITAIKFRKTKSKWGHCTSTGVLQFNWLLLMAPRAVIDYVICHELSHLIHMNHSASFWRHVERHCADYATHKLWLNKCGHQIAL